MWLAQLPGAKVFGGSFADREVAVAVPARNEAATVLPCLAALDRAAGAAKAKVRIVLLVNNSRDGTARAAGAFAPSHCSLRVEEAWLGPEQAHAGGARRLALDQAAAELPPDGILMTTDADSFVDPHWIAANLAELGRGADAVAGVVAFDEAARASLPPMPERRLEWRLALLQARLGWLLDPLPQDPWPNHIWAWGASLALTLAAYRRIGGLPAIPLAEDRALAEAIDRFDLRLRHSHSPIVYTSARRSGRAPGGFADLLHSYESDPSALCDAALEPTLTLARRRRARARLRLLHGGGPGFGRAWAERESADPALERRRLAPGELAAEVARAERLIRMLTHRRSRQARAA